MKGITSQEQKGARPPKKGREHDHPRLATLEGTGDEPLGPGRLEARDEQDRDRDVGQGAAERLNRDAQDVLEAPRIQQRHHERDGDDETPDGKQAAGVGAQPVHASQYQLGHGVSAPNAARAASACGDGRASVQHSSNRKAARGLDSERRQRG